MLYIIHCILYISRSIPSVMHHSRSTCLFDQSYREGHIDLCKQISHFLGFIQVFVKKVQICRVYICVLHLQPDEISSSVYDYIVDISFSSDIMHYHVTSRRTTCKRSLIVIDELFSNS